MPACVNVTAGIVSLEVTDFFFPGFIPFFLTRSYRSNSTVEGLLGRGWGVNLGEEIVPEGDGLVLINAEGRTVRFPRPDPGGALVGNRVEGLQLAVEEYEAQGQTVPVLVIRVGDRVRHYAQVDHSARFRLVRIEDPHRNAIRFVYRNGVLAEIEDTLQRRFLLGYDGRGRLVQVHLVLDGSSVLLAKYVYGPDDLLVQVLKHTGARNDYEYQDGLLVRHTDDRGVEYFNAYDEKRRCVRSWRGSGYYARDYYYDHNRFQTLVVDSRGAATLYRYSEFNLVTETVDALGGVSRFQYDDGNNVILAANQTGSATLLAYDEGKRVVAKTRADGATETFAYDAGGHPVEYVNANGGVFRSEYNEFGDLVASHKPNGATTRFEYDARGSTTTIIFDNGERLVREYSRDLIRFRYNGHPIIEQRFDIFGRLLLVEYRGRHRIEYRYDQLGRRVEEIGIGGAVRLFSYDAAGRLSLLRDSRGAITTYEYNEVGLRTATRRQGHSAEFRYDTEGRLVEIRNSRGERHLVEYNLVGRMIGQRFFDGRTERYEHDAAGAITRIRDAKWREITYHGDRLGRPLVVRHTDGTVSEFQYTPTGRVARAVRDGYVVEFEYDAEDRVVVQRQDTFELHYEYNPMGALVRLTDSDGRVTEFERDPLMHLRGATVTPPGETGAAAPFHVAFAYDDLGTLARIELDGGVSLDRQSNGWRRPTWQRASRDGHTVLEERFTYDEAGKLRERTGWNRGPVVYAYDLIGQLTTVTEDGQAVQRYSYDPEFNLMSRLIIRDGQLHRSELTYGAGNRLVRAGDREYRYDEAGLLAAVLDQGRTTRYTYSDDDLLMRVDHPDGSITEFAYDALRRRVRKAVAGRATRFFWNQQTLWLEAEFVPGAGTEPLRTLHYLFDPGSWAPLAMLANDKGYLVVNDHLGAPQALLDATGELAWRLHSTAWGETLSASANGGSVACRIRFPGQYADEETGLHYNLNRYYEPATGRYTSPDPIGLLGGINLYSYGFDPVNYTDPLGLDCQNFAQGEPPTLYRGDNRSPSQICGNGFQPRNPSANISILDHAGGRTEGWVSTSYDYDTAARFGQDGNQTRYVYVIANPGCAANPGHEVDCDPEVQQRQEDFKKMGMQPEESEFEIAFKNVPPDAVVGYVEVSPNGAVGDFQTC